MAYKNLYSQPLHTVWPVYFPPYCVGFPCHTSVWLRKISLSDGKKPRPSGILRLGIQVLNLFSIEKELTDFDWISWLFFILMCNITAQKIITWQKEGLSYPKIAVM